MPVSVRVFVLAVALALVLPGAAAVQVQEQGLSVRITSPMGRTGVPGAVRIVAQIHHPAAAPLGEVKFFVDQHLLVRGRFARMIPVMLKKGYHLGLGIDENSAMVVDAMRDVVLRRTGRADLPRLDGQH